MSESENKDTFTGVVMTGRRVKFRAYQGWNGDEQVLRKFKVRPSIVRNGQDPTTIGSAIRSVLSQWKHKGLSAIIPEFTIERMAMILSIEIKAALLPGPVLVALELDHGPTRVTLFPSVEQ